jgi:DNA-binding transcriptional ArsR family regulator
MGRSKKQVFSTDQNRLADLAKALGHPARIAILEFLAQSDACMCGDIVEKLPLSQSTVSQHLRELKNAGLIKGDVEGARVCYCIDNKALEKARKLLDKFFTTKRCC